MDCIALEIFIVFFLLIRLQVVVYERSTISKLICRYKPLEAKNRNNLIKAKLLLFTANSAIGKLFTQLSC